VRRSQDDSFDFGGPAETFSVYEFPLHVDAPDEARVVFHEGTTNVFWPLHDRRGRFGFQIDPASPPAPSVEALNGLIRQRVPWFRGEIEQVYWTSTAMFERRLARHFGGDRIWLAGDAAHLTGPVGAQSMNVGLREAHVLARRIAQAIETGGDPSTLDGYDTDRRSEWRSLLNLDDGLTATGRFADALAEDVRKVPSCIPASGTDLATLLAQIGVRID
jgi:2-polyprenyl-6-methoxyphenol hydroxylase-like FAD-dependent oxidoreductase